MPASNVHMNVQPACHTQMCPFWWCCCPFSMLHLQPFVQTHTLSLPVCNILFCLFLCVNRLTVTHEVPACKKTRTIYADQALHTLSLLQQSCSVHACYLGNGVIVNVTIYPRHPYHGSNAERMTIAMACTGWIWNWMTTRRTMRTIPTHARACMSSMTASCTDQSGQARKTPCPPTSSRSSSRLPRTGPSKLALTPCNDLYRSTWSCNTGSCEPTCAGVYRRPCLSPITTADLLHLVLLLCVHSNNKRQCHVFPCSQH